MRPLRCEADVPDGGGQSNMAEFLAGLFCCLDHSRAIGRQFQRSAGLLSAA